MSEIASTKGRKRCAVYCRVSSDERLDQEFTVGPEHRRTRKGKVKSPGPETAPTLGERAKKIPTDEGWDFGYWWS